MSSDEDAMAAYLWDLRAQLESKLRSVTRAQQMLDEYKRATKPEPRAKRRDKIIEHVKAAVAVTKELRIAGHDALRVAKDLP
jgi:hypothetical protein